MRAAIIVLSLTAILSGCAQVRPEADFGKVSDISQARLGQRPLWVQTPEDEAFVNKEVRAILSRGVTQRDAVRLTLVNNPGAQARFEEIGAARADVVQAGLPRNPSLAALFGFPLFQGGPIAALAGQAMLSISDLAEIKDRTAKAQAELEREVFLVGREAMETARDARIAWLEAAYAGRAVRLAAEVARQADRLALAGKRYRQFGLADDGRIARFEAAAARAGLDVRELRARQAVAMERLARLMGVGGQVFELAGEVPDAFSALPGREEAVAYALANNLDIQAAEYAVRAARSGQELEKVRWLKDFDLGAGYEYDIEGNRTLGPGASLKLPLFDQNQAQRAKAAFLARKAERLALEARSVAREAVLRSLEDASLAKTRAEELASGVIPPAERAAKWAKRYEQAMQLSELESLETERALLEARLEHNRSLLEAQTARVHLEYALGGPLSRQGN